MYMFLPFVSQFVYCGVGWSSILAMMSRANVSFDVNHAEKHFHLIKIMVRHLRGKKTVQKRKLPITMEVPWCQEEGMGSTSL